MCISTHSPYASMYQSCLDFPILILWRDLESFHFNVAVNLGLLLALTLHLCQKKRQTKPLIILVIHQKWTNPRFQTS